MPTTKQSIRGNGRFQWNGSGWLGASLGSTAWMLITAGFLVAGGQPFVAIVAFACFALSLAVAFVLWTRRDRLRPFSAILILLAAFSVTIPTAWIATQMLGSAETLARMNWPVSKFSCIFVSVATPATMLWLYLLGRRDSTNPE